MLGGEIPASKEDDAKGSHASMPSTLAQLDSRVHAQSRVIMDVLMRKCSEATSVAACA